MIRYRCWFCNRAYLTPFARAGTRFRCSCGRPVRVPRRSGRSSKGFSLGDWLIESLVYGAAGALIGFGLWFAIFGRVPVVRRRSELLIGLTVAGLLAGVLFGERGIDWLGRRLRDRESG
jgi:hypothetical protein